MFLVFYLSSCDLKFSLQNLRDEASSDYVVALRTAIRCITEPLKYYEKVINVLF